MSSKMLPKTASSNQPNLFYGSLMEMLDQNDPLIALADAINWSLIEDALSKFYSANGRPAKPIRLMAGLLMLKQLENLSDENVVLQWKRNPYYQHFCGMNDYQAAFPCDSTELVKFRKRIGQEGVDVIFGASVALHSEACEEEKVIIDTTAHEKNVTYPTDGKLAIKIINRLHKIAKREGIALRRTYIKEIKGHRITLRFFRHPKKRKKAVSAMKRLRTIAKTLIRDLDRHFDDKQHKRYGEEFYLFMRALLQKRTSRNKIYSLCESHIYAMAKGKDNKSYEYGTKASIVSTYTDGIIVGVSAHDINQHDSKTLEAALGHAHTKRISVISEAVCDRGYRGVKQVGLTQISIPGVALKRDTKEQKEEKRKKFRRRAAIEPIIGHLKNDYRMARNYLKGFVGDQINLLMAACAWNMKKWMNSFIHALFFTLDHCFFVVVTDRRIERWKFALQLSTVNRMIRIGN
jgi:IS5 family transposase